MSGDGHTNETRELNLDDIAIRALQATPGPWRAEVLGSEGYAVTGPPGSGGGHRLRVPRVARCGHEEWDTDRYNAEFIAHAREDVDALVDEVRRLRTEREWVRAIAADCGEHPTATSRDEGCSCDACTKFPADFH